jgi:hypothetical protein
MHIDQLALAKSSIKSKRVTQRTLVKYGQKMIPMIGHRTKLSRSGQWPNVAKTMMPLVGGLCLTADFNQMWPKLCPSSEDFVTQRDFDQMWPKMCPLSEDFITQQTLTKCGPKCARHWRTLSCSGLQPNVAQNVPLIGGLCHAADFDQMWPKLCPY